MHEAYVLSAPAKISNLHIESIASFDNYVIIGTRPGHLCLYQISLSDAHQHQQPIETAGAAVASPPQILMNLKHCNKAFGDGKPIRQIAIIAEQQLLLALANDVVGVYDMHDHNRVFPLVNRVDETKGAAVFALDIKRSRSLTGELVLMVRMAVAVKRKLQLWYWKHNKFLRLGSDIDLTDVPRALLWSGNTIVIGLKSEYLYYDLSESTPIKHDLFPTGSRSQEPCIVQINDYFAVAKDEVLIPVQPRLNSLAGSLTSGTISGANVGQSGGLAIGGSSGSSFASNAQLAADAVVDTFRSFVWSQPIQAFVWDEPYVVALTRNALEVRVKASDADRDTHIQTLLDVPNARFLLRSGQGHLIVASATTFWYVQGVDIARQRQLLLQQKRFHLALQLTEISSESADEKLELKNHIQTAYAYDLFARKAFKESMAEFSKLKTDPCDVIRLFPDLIPSSSGSAVAPGLMPAAEAPTTTTTPALTGRDLENGLVALSNFLTDVRYHVREELRVRPAKTPEYKRLEKELSIIDTTLLKCYLQTNDSLVPSLIRYRFCHFEESEKVLKQYRKLDELRLLYEQNGKHRKALQLLQAESSKPNSRLAGHEQTVQYLLQLGPEDGQLIFEFAGWVLEKNPDDGLTIFTDDMVRDNHLARASVLDYLLRDHKALAVRYMEHIIHTWKETKPIFHEILINQYLLQVYDRQAECELASANGQQAPPEFLSALASARETLQTFLRTSIDYSGETILKKLPPNQLFEERAIVLGKLKFHDKCIAIYIQILGDLEAAAQYCDAVYEADPGNDAVYVSLVEKLLHVPTAPPYSGVPLHKCCQQPEQNIEFVLDLLERHATRFNAKSVLKILPGTIPLYRLRTFIDRALQHQLQRQSEALLQKSFLKAEDLQLQDSLAGLRSFSVVLTELSLCYVCGKKFSNESAFVRQPSGRIVHYLCQ